MQLIREIIGVVVEHLYRFEQVNTLKGEAYKNVPESNPKIELILSDNKYTYGRYDFTPSQWESIKQQSDTIPTRVGRSYVHGKEEEFHLFMYKGLYYLTEIEMTGDEVLLALKNIWQSKKNKLARELDRIKAKAEFEGSVRAPIPEDVQTIVWHRDGGKCVKCGGTQNLEFDHIIPLSKGGSNTARNIQLLCEHCNRSKGARIGG